LLLYNLRKLEKAGILVNRKRLDITSRPPKLSFYELTPIGKIIARHLALLKNELSQIAGENPVFLWIKFLYEDNFFNY
jgi:DNA-binding PadR family transcriptional regulator